jgi:hypothetical protein
MKASHRFKWDPLLKMRPEGSHSTSGRYKGIGYNAQKRNF